MREATETSLFQRLAQRAGRVHSDEGGQSIVYIAMMLILLSLFTMMVYNSGALLHDKMHMQTAADAASISGSSWIARGMNMNSMMNIFLAMLLAEEIFMKAVFWTALVALTLSPAIEAFWLVVCFYTGTCSPAFDAPFDTMDLLPILWETDDDEDFLWDVMEGISDVESSIDTMVPVIAELESVRMATANGATFGIMYPFSIPEEEGELTDLCTTTLSGTDANDPAVRGYNEFQYSAPGALMGALDGLGGVDELGSDMRNSASNLLSMMGLGGPLWGELQVPYHIFWLETAPYHFTNLIFIMAVATRYGIMCGTGVPSMSISFTVDDPWWCWDCDPETISIPNPLDVIGWLFALMGNDGDEVKPQMLKEDWATSRNYYGFAWKAPGNANDEVGRRMGRGMAPGIFENPYGDSVGIITVGMSQLYNPFLPPDADDEEDINSGMFSPHWRTHLSPVVMGSDVAEAASAGIGGSSSGGGAGGLMTGIVNMLGDGVDAVMAH